MWADAAGARGRRAGAPGRYEEGARHHRVPASRRGAGAAVLGRRRVPDRLSATRGAGRHRGAHRSVAGARARGVRWALSPAERGAARRPGHPRHRRGHRARRAAALGPQGATGEGRANGGAVLKAAYFKEHGGSDKILYGDYRDPAPAAAEVVVRVKACALNHVDMLLLDGRFPPPEGLPHVNGCEVAGTIETLGEGVSGRARGERVVIFPGFSCGTCEFCLRGERTVCLRYGYLGAHKDGGYAELVKAPAANLLPLPGSISFEAGAAVPLAMLTSWPAPGAEAHGRPRPTALGRAARRGGGGAAGPIAPRCGGPGAS